MEVKDYINGGFGVWSKGWTS